MNSNNFDDQFSDSYSEQKKELRNNIADIPTAINPIPFGMPGLDGHTVPSPPNDSEETMIKI